MFACPLLYRWWNFGKGNTLVKYGHALPSLIFVNIAKQHFFVGLLSTDGKLVQQEEREFQYS